MRNTLKLKEIHQNNVSNIHFLLATIVIMDSKGYFLQPTSSDKNYDPVYTKQPEIGDTKKSFNIYSNKHLQDTL
jgi:hypothetical protein